MQDFLFGEGGDSINFIIDSGASITSTFGAKDFVESSLKSRFKLSWTLELLKILLLKPIGSQK